MFFLRVSFADISKIHRVLGWEPKISLEEGVKRMLECLDGWKTGPVWTPQTIEQATKAWFENLTRPPAARTRS